MNYPTIEELVSMDAQALFDRIARHMLVQRARSAVDGTRDCLYRDLHGRACAVGAIIPGAVYRESMEHKGITALMLLLTLDEFHTPHHRAFAYFITLHASMLMHFMRVHDQAVPEMWPDDLRTLARVYRLDASIVDRFSPHTERDDWTWHEMPETLTVHEADHVLA
ncbi:hypothetical protein [Paraburkholderia bannensis]|uniref:hypothetical protein n=1 Tax=Paraburkholderia bannensis TaxID=765414 RepID=UPI002AC35642|nr:hypothetical protein [Paraburkholderia bannensis]